jgi:dolichol kinase
MSKKLIAGFLTALIITIFILSFYLEPLHAFVEAILIVSLLSMVYYMLYNLILGILTVGEPKGKKDYYL